MVGRRGVTAPALHGVKAAGPPQRYDSRTSYCDATFYSTDGESPDQTELPLVI